MVYIAISEFRSHLPAFLKKVKKGEEIVLTSRGHEVARLVPPETAQEQARKKLRKLAKYCQIDDVLSPLHEKWDALS